VRSTQRHDCYHNRRGENQLFQKEMESLRIRNEKLAAEVSRLRIENKSLKDKVNKYDFPHF
jgi:cell division protein FtsB